MTHESASFQGSAPLYKSGFNGFLIRQTCEINATSRGLQVFSRRINTRMCSHCPRLSHHCAAPLSSTLTLNPAVSCPAISREKCYYSHNSGDSADKILVISGMKKINKSADPLLPHHMLRWGYLKADKSSAPRLIGSRDGTAHVTQTRKQVMEVFNNNKKRYPPTRFLSFLRTRAPDHPLRPFKKGTGSVPVL